MAAGPIRYKVKPSPDEQFTQTVMIHQLYDIPPAELIKTDERPKISDAYRWLVDNEQRTSKNRLRRLSVCSKWRTPVSPYRA